MLDNFIKNIKSLFHSKPKKTYPFPQKILLIHGFGTGVRDEIFWILSKSKEKQELEYNEFKAFNHLINKGEASVFRWHDRFNASKIKDFLTIEKYIDLYKREKQKAVSPELQKKLYQTIEKENPEIIVCHSMGCYLLLNYLEKYTLNPSVKKIFLVQGDFDKKYKIQNPDILNRIEKNTLRIINVYCPWDTTLITSPFVNNFTWPAGLNRMRNPYIVDVLFPLGNSLNLHNSSLKSRDLLDFVLKY
jgi:hypothetical protein